MSNETDDAGSDIEFTTGYNPDASSGAFRVQTADGGRKGESGEISLRTGKAYEGNSGAVVIETGDNELDGEGGAIYLKVGKSANRHPGGNVVVEAGDATGEYETGGNVGEFMT